MRTPSSPRVVYVSTFPPRRCGLATFTSDVIEATEATGLVASSSVAAISETDGAHGYDPRVILDLTQDYRAGYVQAARDLNEMDIDVVNIQHEFGIFGGDDGSYLLELVSGLEKPLVTTFHTVLSRPDPRKRRIVRWLSDASEVVVVLARQAVNLLVDGYGIRREKVVMIPHGAPELNGLAPDAARAVLGLEGRFVLCTLGLINPGKGIEYVLEALPGLVAIRPETLYLVLGETHPGVKRWMGEAYRERLMTMVEDLDLQEHVRFIDSYLSQDELVRHLMATDVYITPYLGRDQIVSGTLAYAVSLGKAIISTRYLYAEELLGRGAGVMVDFRDAPAIEEALKRIALSPGLKTRLENRAREVGRSLAWSRVGQSYASVFTKAMGPSTALIGKGEARVSCLD